MGRPLEPDDRHGRLTARRARRAPQDRSVSPAGARIAAFHILRDVARGARAKRAAERRLEGLAARERAFAVEISFGVFRLRGRLDAELARHVHRPLRELEPPVLDWLRIGLYQLRAMRVPDHAAVHETVEGARRTLGRRPLSLVNAVLRAAARGEPPDLFPSLDTDPAGCLSTRGSHPEWLVRRWLERWPLAEVVRLVENDNAPPPVVFRPLGAEGAARARELAARESDGAAREEERREEGVRGARRRAGGGGAGEERVRLEVRPLEGWPGLFRLVAGDPAALLRRVPAVVQDPAASAVVDYAAAGARGPVYDACAAPGGKAIALAFAAPDARPLVAGDRSRERLRWLLSARERTGAAVVGLVADALRPPLRSAGTVIVDAPCTGTGVLRRRPDARWGVSPERLASLVRLQTGILEACAEIVEPGGRLVYATCSLEPEENEQQVESFLARHPEFRRDPAPHGGAIPAAALSPCGDLRLLPQVFRTDGAYASRLRRAEAA